MLVASGCAHTADWPAPDPEKGLPGFTLERVKSADGSERRAWVGECERVNARNWTGDVDLAVGEGDVVAGLECCTLPDACVRIPVYLIKRASAE